MKQGGRLRTEHSKISTGCIRWETHNGAWRGKATSRQAAGIRSRRQGLSGRTSHVNDLRKVSMNNVRSTQGFVVVHHVCAWRRPGKVPAVTRLIQLFPLGDDNFGPICICLCPPCGSYYPPPIQGVLISGEHLIQLRQDLFLAKQ